MGNIVNVLPRKAFIEARWSDPQIEGGVQFSSFQIPPGCEIKMYENENYTGTPTVFKQSQIDTGQKFTGNKKVRSIEINCQ